MSVMGRVAEALSPKRSAVHAAPAPDLPLDQIIRKDCNAAMAATQSLRMIWSSGRSGAGAACTALRFGLKASATRPITLIDPPPVNAPYMLSHPDSSVKI